MIPKKAQITYKLLLQSEAMTRAVAIMLEKNNIDATGAEAIVASAIKMGYEMALMDQYGNKAVEFFQENGGVSFFGNKKNG